MIAITIITTMSVKKDLVTMPLLDYLAYLTVNVYLAVIHVPRQPQLVTFH